MSVEFRLYHEPLRRARQFFLKSKELTDLGEHVKAESVFKLGKSAYQEAVLAKWYYLQEGWPLSSIVYAHREGDQL